MGEVGFDGKIKGETCKIFLFFVKLSNYFGTFIDYFELPFSGLHLELSDPLTNTVPKAEPIRIPHRVPQRESRSVAALRRALEQIRIPQRGEVYEFSKRRNWYNA